MNALDPSRRRFLGGMTAAASALLTPVVARAAPPAAPKPGALPRLAPDQPQAKALAYTENAASAKHALFKPGSSCSNCNFYRGVAGQASGPCQMFPQNTVSAKGWCLAWAKKA